MKRERIGLFALVIATAVLGILTAITGCAADDIATAKAAIPAVQAEVEKTQVALTQTQAEIAAAKAAGQDTAGAEQIAAAMQKSLAFAQATLDKLNRVVANATSTADLIEQGSKEASSYAGGYGPLVALAGTTIAALVRSHQNRQAARDIAYAVEKAKVDGVIDFKQPDTQAKLSADMGARAKRIVDEAQGYGYPLPI